MAELKSANVTKYDAGGSGDNYIADGYIKTVEKVWIDSYNNTTMLGTEDSICIGLVPKNKKITEVVVYMPATNTGATSLGTIFLGSASTETLTAGTAYLGAMRADGFATTTFDLGTAATLRLSPDKFGTVTNKDTYLWIRYFPVNELDAIATAGTIRSIIKYT